jgi:hypothetical protein
VKNLREDNLNPAHPDLRTIVMSENLVLMPAVQVEAGLEFTASMILCAAMDGQAEGARGSRRGRGKRVRILE